MHILLVVIALLTLLAYIAGGLEVTLGGRRLAHLENIPPVEAPAAPRVSIVVPACNEERGIEQGLRSLLAQDYPNLEVIAIDDRSVDGTGTVIDRLAASDARIRPIHIRDLPAGWLGKNHALHMGAAQAGGEILLFTDADVVMEPSVVARAVAWLLDRKLDHLAAAPRAIVHGFLSNAFLGLFALGFSLYTKPWKVSDPKSSKSIGIGAFNMIRASAYRDVGGHSPIAMRPDDDVKLGKLLKLRGYRQEMVFATSFIVVEWYHSFREMRRGLMKNLFAAADYSIMRVIASVVAQAILFVWPFLVVVLTRGALEQLNALIVFSLFALFLANSSLVGIRFWWCLTLPLAALVSMYLMLRSMALTLRNDGIEWRGTHYPLAQLRANRI
jgi:cellulose synthase/poly-beta-1,6-N-acetylglucosamine synthase-like glycosyltransferase